MTYAPECEDDAAPLATHVHCLDDDTYTDDSEHLETGECPRDFGHAVEPVHITATALGFEDDEDFLVHRSGDYIYPARWAQG